MGLRRRRRRRLSIPFRCQTRKKDGGEEEKVGETGRSPVGGQKESQTRLHVGEEESFLPSLFVDAFSPKSPANASGVNAPGSLRDRQTAVSFASKVSNCWLNMEQRAKLPHCDTCSSFHCNKLSLPSSSTIERHPTPFFVVCHLHSLRSRLGHPSGQLRPFTWRSRVGQQMG